MSKNQRAEKVSFNALIIPEIFIIERIKGEPEYSQVDLDFVCCFFSEEDDEEVCVIIF